MAEKAPIVNVTYDPEAKVLVDCGRLKRAPTSLG
jgi:hypothetical protein